MLLWVFSTHVHLRSHARVRASSCMELGGVLPQLSCSWDHSHAVAPRGSLLPVPWPGSQGFSGFRLPTLLLCRLGQLESPLTQSGERGAISLTQALLSLVLKPERWAESFAATSAVQFHGWGHPLFKAGRRDRKKAHPRMDCFFTFDSLLQSAYW